MERVLRPRITGVVPARLIPDRLTVLRMKTERARQDRGLFERVLEPERPQLLDRMRQQIDADAERADVVDGFEDARSDADAVQCERATQAREPGADDDHFEASHCHVGELLSMQTTLV